MKKFVLEYWTPVVVWLLTIFFFSTDLFSAGETSHIILPVLVFFFPGLSSNQLDFWHIVLRKFGHISEYAILAFFVFRGIHEHEPDSVRAKAISMALVLCVAISDELHQRMTAFRGASPVDVAYDCLGAVWALWLIHSYETRNLRTHSIL